MGETNRRSKSPRFSLISLSAAQKNTVNSVAHEAFNFSARWFACVFSVSRAFVCVRGYFISFFSLEPPWFSLWQLSQIELSSKSSARIARKERCGERIERTYGQKGRAAPIIKYACGIKKKGKAGRRSVPDTPSRVCNVFHRFTFLFFFVPGVPLAFLFPAEWRSRYLRFRHVSLE